MAYDLEEQEQLDAIKDWWKEHGNAVLLGVAVFVTVIGGMQGWRYYQNRQTVAAAALYDELRAAMDGRDDKKVRGLAGQLMEQYPRTAYASRAALTAAGTNADSGDLKSAKAQAQWALDHGTSEEVKDVARLRLAGLLLDEKNYGDALKLLESKHGPAFDGLYGDMKGDVLAASGKKAEARAAYQAALEKLDAGAGYRNVVQMKLNALGS